MTSSEENYSQNMRSSVNDSALDHLQNEGLYQRPISFLNKGSKKVALNGKSP